jgi:hypothetical protein
VPRANEQRFQAQLKAFCEAAPQCNEFFSVREAEAAAGGKTDLVFHWKNSRDGYPDIVVELKSEERMYAMQYEDHAGQPLQYAGSPAYGRVSILYVQFKSDASVRIGDTIRIRQNLPAGSQQLVLCLAQQAFASVPSAGGEFSVGIS